MDDLETSSVTRIIDINTVPQHRYLFLEKEAENKAGAVFNRSLVDIIAACPYASISKVFQ